MADTTPSPTAAAIWAARDEARENFSRRYAMSVRKAEVMERYGLDADQAEVRMHQAGELSLEELSEAARRHVEAERRAIVADMVRELADRLDITEREAMLRLAVMGDLGAGDVPADIWAKAMQSIRGNYG